MIARAGVAENQAAIVFLYMRFIGVIPSRYASSRLPGKALIPIAGKPLVRWVYERARLAHRLSDLLVATDDRRIVEVVQSFGGKALLTDAGHISGSDRVAEVAQTVRADVYLNIQGDEPLISPHTIDAVCAAFDGDGEIQVATARVAIASSEAVHSPHVVKVVADSRGFALYFSRAPVPYNRTGSAAYFKHLGIYGYRRAFLQALKRLPPSVLERTEGLEQLRFLENGIPIRLVTVAEDSLGVDTPEDVERVRPLLENTRQTGRRAVRQAGRSGHVNQIHLRDGRGLKFPG